MRPQVVEVGLDVLLPVGVGEEGAEGGVVRQMAERRELQLVERHVRRIEIDGGDRDRRCREVAQHVAAARRDGDQALALLEAQRLEIDDGVFPDLRIDEAAEGEREQPLLDALSRHRLVAMHRLAQALVALRAAAGHPRGNGVLG